MSIVIKNEPPKFLTSNADQAEKHLNHLGSTLNNSIATFVTAIGLANQAANFVANHGSDIVCIATTTIDAVEDISKGNYIKGAIKGLASVKKVVNLATTNDSKKILALLKDHQAGLEVTGEFLVFNNNTLNQVQEDVKSIAKTLNDLDLDLAKVKNLSEKTLEELKAEKKEVIEQFNKANQEFKLAQLNYKAAEELVCIANTCYQEISEGIKAIQELAYKKGSTLDEVNTIAKKMQLYCTQALNASQKSMQCFKKGREQLEKANALYKDASFKSGLLIGKSEKTLSNITEINSQAQEKVNQAQQKTEELKQKVETLQETNANLITLNNQALASNKEIMDMADKEQFGMVSILGGAVPGALIGSSVLGPMFGGMGGGYVGLELAHNRKKIANNIGDWFFGIGEESVLELLPNEIIAFKFNDYSSGFYGRWITKSKSQTVGTIKIRLSANEFFEMKFDLRNKKIVSDAELRELSIILNQKLNSQEITKSACQAIITSLHQFKVGNKPMLVDDNQLFFNMVKIQCDYEEPKKNS